MTPEATSLLSLVIALRLPSGATAAVRYEPLSPGLLGPSAVDADDLSPVDVTALAAVLKMSPPLRWCGDWEGMIAAPAPKPPVRPANMTDEEAEVLAAAEALASADAAVQSAAVGSADEAACEEVYSAAEARLLTAVARKRAPALCRAEVDSDPDGGVF